MNSCTLLIPCNNTSGFNSYEKTQQSNPTSRLPEIEKIIYLVKRAEKVATTESEVEPAAENSPVGKDKAVRKFCLFFKVLRRHI